ncbi:MULTISPECIES: hypothetical protein [unclassified Corynebacterium]|uniref:hypothetical protein n=1 Tax=unclassified Corynebacterium TaxID=2624378 RepID=UPI0029CA5D17|nr:MULTISPECIES: hypothetical protein [unclassified Corynebacterium]WPF66839.1 hypothetical protein OLX12_03705 [Corynebacterium sp. 22KM0430]WPF69327.1 hypothetical protein OLW90_03700 [Corynebacterium sp. 21KM1197]
MNNLKATLFNILWLTIIAVPSFGTANEGMNKQYHSFSTVIGAFALAAAFISTLWAVRNLFHTRPDNFVRETFLVFGPLYAIMATLYIGGREWITVLFWLAVVFMLLVNNARFLGWARGLSEESPASSAGAVADGRSAG